mmetsp:Transcript_23031/g.33067  ORF Transcript_23031/g.33067 Transcript_23031/m.33067 type:complete len:206 (+) Transcript_23031:57-674(+)
MGNNNSPQGTVKGMQAVARTTPNIELPEFQLIYADLKKVAEETSNEWISKDAFDETIKKIEKFESSDIDIFVKLFTLFDVQGNSTINYKDFVAGAACCLSTATFEAKLIFGMSIYDTLQSKNCLKGDLKKLLNTINNVVSYFGDPVIRPNQIDAIVFEMFRSLPPSGGKGIPFEACVENLLANDIVKMFLNGEGRLRFGDPELKV